MQSRPTWARELKLERGGGFCAGGLSRPTWARELKLEKLDYAVPYVVAPHVGA